MRLKERFLKEIRVKLAEDLKIKNRLAVPNVRSVTVAVGLSHGLKDPKFLDVSESVLKRITGQFPIRTKAKQSISNFKIRKGMVVGMKVTLRGPRMWDFLEKLLTVTFPRVRDFRGISIQHVDRTGNLSVGFRDYLPFPEIRPDEVERLHGLQVTVSSSAGTRDRGMALFRAMGFPFKD